MQLWAATTCNIFSTYFRPDAGCHQRVHFVLCNDRTVVPTTVHVAWLLTEKDIHGMHFDSDNSTVLTAWSCHHNAKYHHAVKTLEMYFMWLLLYVFDDWRGLISFECVTFSVASSFAVKQLQDIGSLCELVCQCDCCGTLQWRVPWAAKSMVHPVGGTTGYHLCVN